MAPDPAALEAMCAAWWDVHATVKWCASMPQDKEHYRENMRAAIAAMPKLSPVSRQAILYGLEELEGATRVRLTMGGAECPELAVVLLANLRAAKTARAELEKLP